MRGERALYGADPTIYETSKLTAEDIAATRRRTAVWQPLLCPKPPTAVQSTSRAALAPTVMVCGRLRSAAPSLPLHALCRLLTSRRAGDSIRAGAIKCDIVATHPQRCGAFATLGRHVQCRGPSPSTSRQSTDPRHDMHMHPGAVRSMAPRLGIWFLHATHAFVKYCPLCSHVRPSRSRHSLLTQIAQNRSRSIFNSAQCCTSLRRACCPSLAAPTHDP